MIVMKFGGTSLGDASRIQQVADLVANASRTPCVVLSAIGDSTDELLAISDSARGGDLDGATAALADLFGRYDAIATELLQTPDTARAPLERMRADVELLLRGLAKRPETDLRARDAIVAHGERVSTLLLSARLAEQGVAVEAVDARAVMRTDERFGNARPQTGTIRQLAHQTIAPLVGRGTVAVTQGFVGSTADGATTTLGRGGSDWSAALLGAALGAEEVQIWTDVEGVMTADPRVVPDVVPIAVLSPEEAAELAAFGARVLHPSTIKPAVDREIPVTVRHTQRPGGAFTRIAHSDARPAGGIAALASRGPVSVMTMTSRRMLDASGYLARLFEVFGEHDVSIDLITTAEVSVACTVEHDAPVARLVAALDGLAHCEVLEDQAIVAAIGDGLQQTDRMLERACRALHPIRPAMVSLGGNSRNASFVVPFAERHDAVRRLHAEFFGQVVAKPVAHADAVEASGGAQ